MKIRRLFLLVVLALSTGTCASVTPELLAPALGPEGVTFAYYEPGARSVAVAGTFNGWAPNEVHMEQDAGVWMVTIPLESGEYPFMYVINGEQWITPPKADDFVPDGFGQTNGVVIVP